MLLHICGSRPRCLTNETSFETFIGWIVVVVQSTYFTITQAVLYFVQCHIPLFVAITQAVLCKIGTRTINSKLKFGRGKAMCYLNVCMTASQLQYRNPLSLK